MVFFKREPQKKFTELQTGNLIFSEFKKVINNKLPLLFDHFEQLPEVRTRSEYNMIEICGGALVMDLLKCGSRNSYNNLRRSSVFCKNFEETFNISLPHADTFDDVFRVSKPSDLENVRKQLVRALLENKSLREYRLFNTYYLIAVDATGIASFDQRHCEHCLSKTSKNGVTTYFHYVLEAKLVTADGLAISLASEFVENLPGRDFDKQDCEQKAFARLAAKIKKDFPRLPICLLADGLYPNQTVFDICRKNNWRFIITLKDKVLRTFQEEVGLLKPTLKSQTVIVPDKNYRITQEYSYLNNIEYNNNTYSWLSCLEIQIHKKSKLTRKNQFVYITDIELNRENIIETGKSGRLRWKIENQGFNTQKNSGYELEHKYSRSNYNAMQNYYLILQIAHLINQLVERSKTIKILLAVHSKTTIKNLWSILSGYLRFIQHEINEIYLE